jgi:ABC-type Zn uptake system ZnuABC Zn-binding protein ZnuA
MPASSIAAVSAAFLLLTAGTPLALATPVQVVATLPILKEFAEQVGREHVQVKSLITGFESEHSYSPKPSDLKAVAEARLLLEIGLGLEVWVSGLVRNAANSRLRIVTTSRDISVIRDAAEPTSQGNPHIWLDPENAKIMTRHIAEGLAAVDPSHTTEYRANLEHYLQRLSDSERELQRRVTGLRDRRIVTYHPAWPYFARRFGFRIEGDIIRQIGAEPTGAELARLAHRMKTEKIKVIVSEPQLNQKVAQALAGETGARIVLLSVLPGAIKGTESYLSMLQYDIETLAEALES